MKVNDRRLGVWDFFISRPECGRDWARGDAWESQHEELPVVGQCGANFVLQLGPLGVGGKGDSGGGSDSSDSSKVSERMACGACGQVTWRTGPCGFAGFKSPMTPESG